MVNKLKSILFMVLAAWSFSAGAQNTLEKQLVGTWTATNIAEAPEGQREAFEVMKGAFLKASFRFNQDKSFVLTSPSPMFNFKHAHWKINLETGSVVIQEWADRDKDRPVLLEILVLNVNQKVLFKIEETPVMLEMKKE